MLVYTVNCAGYRPSWRKDNKRVRQMENLKYFYLVIYWTHKVHNDIIFLSSLHCVPPLQKRMDTSRKKVFWLTVQPLVHHLLHIFVRPERLASHRLFEWSKDMKITWGEVWRVRRMWKTLEGQSLDCCNSRTGSMGQALSCCNKTPALSSPRLLDLIAGRRWFLRRSAHIALVTVFPLGM